MTDRTSVGCVDSAERPAEVLDVLPELSRSPRRLHRLLPELSGLAPESFELPLHELPSGAPRVARDRGGIRAGQVAGVRERSGLVARARLATRTRPGTVAAALLGAAARATVRGAS